MKRASRLLWVGVHCWLGAGALPACAVESLAAPPRTASPSEPQPRLEFASHVAESEVPMPPLWAAVEDGEVMRAVELGQEEGAVRLFKAVTEGGGRGRIALLALPWAPDGSAVEAQLCELLPAVRGEDRVLLLRAITALAEPPLTIGEKLERGDSASCLNQLSHLVAEGKLNSVERDLASQALAYYRQIRYYP